MGREVGQGPLQVRQLQQRPYSAVFYTGGGIAYRCSDESVHAIDDTGQRVLDTNGTELGVSMKGDRIYWMNGETAKSVSV